jgi:alpha-glucuronidase
LETNLNFREYDAWLQPGALHTIPPVRMKGTEAAAFAMEECGAGLKRLFGDGILNEDADFILELLIDDTMAPDAYRLRGSKAGLTICASDQSGLLYGVYALLMRLKAGDDPALISLESAPKVKRRVLNHWDNMSGTVERGYSGNSLFFKEGALSYDASRIRDYARLIASVGINEIAINNVNVTEQSAKLITEEMLPKAAGLAGIFRPFGIRLILSVHFEGPVITGHLPTADPMDENVQAWWRETADAVYRYIPDLAGFLVKADSEFRDGPAAFGRTQADGANVIARALAPHQGTVYWRCFVYNCNQDWRDMKTDRPKAAYEHFFPLDGEFLSNVVLQIKFGPTDFQVREPNSPLLGAMAKTRQAVEFQITQEYTGQQIDLYTLAVQWEEVLSTPVSDTRLTRSLIGREVDTVVAVSNVGDDLNWTGHTLAQANLYAFGRMAWDPSLTARNVTEEWIIQTFGKNPSVINKLTGMMLSSRCVYEKYNAPLGIGWMVTVGKHYGPSVDGYEYMKWGTYHRADHKAIGVDRTKAGTGFTSQYHPFLDKLYSDKNTCPEELLLFFHRLPYTYRLKSGKTLIQHIYDTHFEGAMDVQGFIDTWKSLKELLPASVYESVLAKLARQLENAVEWRDVVNTYFLRKTGIRDEKGRLIFE